MRQPKEWTDDELAAGQKFTDAAASFFPEAVIERTEEIEATARITEIQGKYEAELLALENVVGVAAGLKMTAGELTKTWSLTVLVEQKLPKTKVPKAQLVPGQVDDVPVDVVEVGKIEALAFTAHVRPLMPGYSIGHHNITAGTFGCLVRDLQGDGHLILSNNHVLANTNLAKPGDEILQPGPYDGGVFPADGCARLERFEPIVLSPWLDPLPPGYPPGYNLVDAAVARPALSREVIANIIGIVIPRGIGQVFVGDRVIKVGRTTQVTTGRVMNVNATVMVGYGDAGVAIFRHQIITTNMAAGGDSGSLLMDYNLNAVGLLFAGSGYVTIHNHIADVEAALGVRPMTAPRFS
jgi:hypothetical protein